MAGVVLDSTIRLVAAYSMSKSAVEASGQDGSCSVRRG